MNGYRMLKPGGLLVYSTCSFTVSQNEAIVAWFLDQCPGARIEALPMIDSLPALKQPNRYSDPFLRVYPGMRDVVRFAPRESGTSGLFIARIRKAGEVEE
jgi:16S rRNA C967 or C1407 C5-methylase (RsmB/RsmF family)